VHADAVEHADEDDANAQTKMLGFIGRDPDWPPR
jgi:hypothetical protein